MRWLFFVAALAFTSVASAQDGSSLRDIGPFRFGMSVDEARAADPSLRSRDDRGIDLTSFRSRTPTAFGEIGITPLLSFRGGRLTRVVFETGGPVREDGRCAEVFDMVLGALEERHGAFSGASGPSEYGELRSTRTTARGSTVRVYEHAGQSMRHANRPDGGWMEVVAHVGPYPNVPSGMMLCMITIDVRPQALPPPLDLASPTSAQLASARVLENPQWSEQADSDAYEMALPPYFPTADVELEVTLDCLIVEGGRINCAVASEQPPSAFYGEFALRLSRAYRAPATADGASTVGRRVSVPVEVSLLAPH